MIRSRRKGWAGHIALIGERRGVHRVLVGKPVGKRRLGRLRHRWEDYFKFNIQELRCGVMEWIDLDQGRDR
jgi:hypothetical protein